MVKEIALTQGQVTIVDDEDYDYLMQWKWHVAKWNGTFYVVCSGKRDNYGKQHCASMHRTLMNAQKGYIVDHINHDPLDNRKCNLRICNNKQNVQNSKIDRINNTSGYKGVFRSKNVWKSVIEINDKPIYIGTFNNPTHAAYAYDEAAIYYFKEFACINFPNLTSKDRNCSLDILNKIRGVKYPSIRKNNKSEFIGVKWSKRGNKWESTIKKNRKTYWLGYFKSKIEAALVRDRKAFELYDDAAFLNFPFYIYRKLLC